MCLCQGDVQNIDREVRKCLIDAFKITDNNFLLNASNASPSWKDGTTAVAILVLDDVIYVANLGDSKAVLCRESDSGKLSAVKLTKDHSPVDVSSAVYKHLWSALSVFRFIMQSILISAPSLFYYLRSLKREAESKRQEDL